MSQDVTIRLRVDGGAVSAGEIHGVESALQGLASQAKKTEAAAGSLGSIVGGLFGALGGAATAVQILRTADAMTNLDSKLRLVEKSSLAVAAAQNGIEQIARQTHQSLTDVGDTYYRIAKGADALGLSQQEVVDVTRTVSQAIALSGSSAESAQAALMQFGQALASGTLRGEELNSVMEQAPGLAEAIAQGLGVTTGALRQMGADGELSVNQIVEALKKVAPSVAAQFETLTPTLGMAMTDLGNSITMVIDRINDVSGATGGLATAITGIADWIAGPLADAAGLYFGYLRSNFMQMFGYIDYFGASMANLWEVVTTTFSALWDNALNGIKARLADWADSMANLLGKLPLDAAQEASAGLAQWSQATAASIKPQRDLGAELKALNDKLAAQGQQIFENSDALSDEAVNAAYAANANKSLAASTDKHSAAAQANTAQLEALAKAREKEQAKTAATIQSLYEESAALRMTERDRARFEAQLRLGTNATDAERIATDQLVQSNYDLAASQKAAKEAAEEQQKAQEKALAEMQKQADPWADAMKEAIGRVDNAFVDMWKNIDDGFDGFADGLKEAMKQLLAELAHLAITRPILMRFASALGVGGSSSGAFASGGMGGGSGGFGGFDLGSLFSMGSNFMKGYTSGGGGWAGIGSGFNSMAGGFFGGGSGLASGITNMGGSFAPFLEQWGTNAGVFTSTPGAGGMGPAISR